MILHKRVLRSMLTGSAIMFILLTSVTVNAASDSCPCFSASIIDAGLQQFGPEAIKIGTGIECSDDAQTTDTLMHFSSFDFNFTVFVEPSLGAFKCGWGQSGGSGRPIGGITAQEARSCSTEITNSAAWSILGCPKNTR